MTTPSLRVVRRAAIATGCSASRSPPRWPHPPSAPHRQPTRPRRARIACPPGEAAAGHDRLRAISHSVTRCRSATASRTASRPPTSASRGTSSAIPRTSRPISASPSPTPPARARRPRASSTPRPRATAARTAIRPARTRSATARVYPLHVPYTSASESQLTFAETLPQGAPEHPPGDPDDRRERRLPLPRAGPATAASRSSARFRPRSPRTPPRSSRDCGTRRTTTVRSRW